MRRVELIINPISGRGRGRRAAERAAAVFAGAGVEVVMRPTTQAGDARRFAAAIDGGVDACVVVGGDGTLNEVISGLVRPIPVGLVPVGTANVLARDLRIPFRPEDAARLVLSGAERLIDVGRANGRPFLAMIGVGFDGAIVKSIAEARRGPINYATYVAPTFRAIAAFRATPLMLVVDGVPLPEPCFGVFVTNTRCYGGFFSVTPDAAPDDGALHYAAWLRGGKPSVLRYFTCAVLRTKSSAAKYGSGRRFRIEAVDGSAVPVQADGDAFGVTPVDVEIVPGAARIFAAPVAARILNGVP